MLTHVSALERVATLYGDRPAIRDRERNFTWSEHVERISRMAGFLASINVGPGDRFGIICENSFRYTELLHSGYWGGAIPVPINHRLAPPEIAHILRDSECKIVALGKDFLAILEAEELAPWVENCLYIGPTNQNINILQYEEVLLSIDPIRPRLSDEDDLALLLYTGGTTGKSKGVKLTHKNILSNGMQMAIAMRIETDDIYLHAAPMFHAADLLCTGFTLMGATHSYLPIFSPVAALNTISSYSVTKTMMAPTMIIMCLTDSSFGKFDISCLDMMLYGSSPMAAEWVEKSIAGFKGTQIVQGYGLTETSPILTFLDWQDHKTAIETGNTDILRAAGRPTVGLDIKITDDKKNEVPIGKVGEVTVRGPQVSSGYLNRPEENEHAFNNGWFYTGDVGRIDNQGILYLLDRKKDLVVSGGENIYTSEVEAALYQHPYVQECAVIGIPDEKFGESLFAVIVPSQGKLLTQKDIVEHCRKKIGGFKIPRQMEFVDAMPKSAMGKILKTELRRIYGKS